MKQESNKVKDCQNKKKKNSEIKQNFCPTYIQELSLGNKTT
jgi:hypothetical protein